MRITLSSMQYTMLKEVLRVKTFSLDTAALYRQPTYTSMARRGYLVTEYDPASEQTIFVVTPAARAAVAQFEADDILRSRESSNLSAWLDSYVKRSLRRHARAS